MAKNIKTDHKKCTFCGALNTDKIMPLRGLLNLK